MPRIKRQLSTTNTYHIVMRSINRQIIFEEKNDYYQFLYILKHYRIDCNCKILAYCLMDNHIHLLVQTNGDPPGPFMQKLESRFVHWYNKKYERTGHLFQGRFCSEPVNDEIYLLTVFRYIHRNPVKANVCQSVNDFPWSSVHSYLSDFSTIVDTQTISGLFNSKNEMVSFLNTETNDRCLEYPSSRIPDNEAVCMLFNISHCSTLSEFQRLHYEKRNLLLSTLRNQGIKISQLCRITGIPRRSIQNALNEFKSIATDEYFLDETSLPK